MKICACPKRDLDREEKDTRLQKNTVFRRMKKCISQEIHHSNHHHHHNNNNINNNNNDNGPPPNKIIKIESTESESENLINTKTYTLPVSENLIF